ncbi:MAG: phosphate ABC transporter substrate-binding protein [Thermoguttaceae bacterium]|jgi:phosphate transport system substrate-binding protein|nr:phosphate ABC transporter substrate-binding protein [Thermoguttaceae bacterium]
MWHGIGRTGLLVGLMGMMAAGCGPSGKDSVVSIRVEGSDTMVNIAQAWAEKYHQAHPEVSIQVLGGGSGVGIASLVSGNCDLANTSRKMTEKELQEAQAQRGVEPVEHIVGYDALGVYVHRDNPIDEISIGQLAEIYGDEGTITRWSQLGAPPGCGIDKIVRVGRQNSSGTYEYFRSVVLGKRRDFKLGSVDANGSKDVVALVSRTPGAIGYSGMGYATPEVKMLRVSRGPGHPAVAPTVENAKNSTYPITRPLQIYTLGQPSGAIGEYLDWIKSAEGQEIVTALGYVALP